MGGAGAWVLLWCCLACGPSVGAQGVGAARPHQAGQTNGAFVAAVVGEPFHGVKSEKNHTRNMKNVVSQHDNLSYGACCVLTGGR